MGAPYSMDLRERVVAAVLEEGLSRHKAAARFGVGYATAIEWVKRIPNPTGDEGVVEIRPLFETEDFGERMTPELREQESRLRERLESAR